MKGEAVRSNGVIKMLGPDDRAYYTSTDLMALLGIGRSKALQMMRQFRVELIESNQITDLYPKGKVPKEYVNRRCGITYVGGRNEQKDKKKAASL